MPDTTEYASYVIDLTDAMLDHRRGLNTQQVSHLETINRRAVEFVTTFLLHEKADLDTLYTYFSYDSIQPISIIIGYSEYMLICSDETMLPAYREAIEEIRDCGYALRDDMQGMLEELTAFMDTIGYERKDQAAQPVQAIAAKEEITEVPRKPIQALAPKEEITQTPRQPIQPLAPKEEITEAPRKPIQPLAPRTSSHDDVTYPSRPPQLISPKTEQKPIQRLQPR